MNFQHRQYIIYIKIINVRHHINKLAKVGLSKKSRHSIELYIPPNVMNTEYSRTLPYSCVHRASTSDHTTDFRNTGMTAI